jgi:hypothetical protein
MSARIVLNGKVVWEDNKSRASAQDYGRRKSALPLDRDGNLIDHRPIASHSPESPFRVGEARYDPEEDVSYRVVAAVDPREGWATTRFWQERWGVTHRELLTLVRRGLCDSAALEQSQVRFYRCRDEQRISRDPILSAVRVRRMKLADQLRHTKIRQAGNAYGRASHGGSPEKRAAAQQKGLAAIAAKRAAAKKG